MEQLFEGVGPVFWIIATVLLVSGFMVVSLKNIFHSALFLILCLFSVAGIFLLLEAEFLAAAQVLIYVGAVAILIIFAIMLTGNLASRRIRQLNENVLVGFFVSVVFVFAGVLLIRGTTTAGVWHYAAKDLTVDNIKLLGQYLMTEYALPFEIVSVLLVAAMIGAIVLARKERS
ncbi:MAG TPA: NADH-quinone oxidoreductase subunit J [candidate division Zixibacteria bacterium]|nr:NADH-quinone oxidoreductase subunit J [candidate division Zixibacteria bacterium]MDD4916587.1 NADH-quinone oxidoreductase subunit J [candidate division Zixibacteria bacterium]MDM7973753.1 NADH-quinone oxidoreductase subunit J [candidate division Zixibacteria bacterium]HPM37827.1 NADH-quinone oxidoreductase subunit J [candidate division Zixibacteria bacterium]